MMSLSDVTRTVALRSVTDMCVSVRLTLPDEARDRN